MLALRFRDGDYAFVYCEGRAIGAILAGDASHGGIRPRSKLLFSGEKLDFEVLRPSVVASRFGEEELKRLKGSFSVTGQKTCS